MPPPGGYRASSPSSISGPRRWLDELMNGSKRIGEGHVPSERTLARRGVKDPGIVRSELGDRCVQGLDLEGKGRARHSRIRLITPGPLASKHRQSEAVTAKMNVVFIARFDIQSERIRIEASRLIEIRREDEHVPK